MNRSRKGMLSAAVALGLFTIQASAITITEYSVADSSVGSATNPVDIVSGPDGNLWFAYDAFSAVGKISPAGVVKVFPTHSADTPAPPFEGIGGITTGGDGNLWFTDYAYNAIGKITPAGAIQEFTLGGTEFKGLYGITKGPDGNVWFVNTNNIGKTTPAGVTTQFPIPTAGAAPVDIVAGPDGNLWFTETGAGNIGSPSPQIGRITPAGVVTEFSMPPKDAPINITAGADGNLWFTEPNCQTCGPNERNNKIGKITPAGVITEYTTPTSGSAPFDITNGPDGNIWFTENNANQVARITAGGEITEFPIPTLNSKPVGITTGPDGNIWFTEWGVNKIGKIALSSSTTSTINGYISGNWFNPTQSGQGFQLEAATGNTMVAIWFTYAPDGSGQNWIYAQGAYDSTKNSVTLPAVIETGAKFPPNFKSSDVDKKPWGTLTFTFTDCNNGTASWSSTLPGYGSGSMPITRLTQIQGTVCP